MIGGNKAVQSLAGTLPSAATATTIGTKARAQVNIIDRSAEGSKADGQLEGTMYQISLNQNYMHAQK
eukprot:11789600-Ditylum_brightwellii.AAC.1